MNDFRFRIAVCRFLLALALAAGLSVPAFAQAPAPQTTPAAMVGFERMSAAAPREELPATPLVFYAYAFVWLALIVYVFTIWHRMTRVEQDLAAVKRRLQDGTGGH
jgi:hypothetical protein